MIGIGMACGLGAVPIAIVATLFVTAVLLIFDAGQRARARMARIAISVDEPRAAFAQIRSVFPTARIVEMPNTNPEPGRLVMDVVLGEATDALQRAAAALMEFFMSGKIDQVTLVANGFLESMAEVTIAHLLLQAAVIADAKRQEEGDEQSQEDYDFYSGKVMAAKHFVSYVLPSLHAKIGAMIAGDRSALDMSDGAFSTAY